MKLTLSLALSGGGGAAGFSPIQRSPLIWLKSNVGVTQGGGSATAWADQSVNGNNFASGTNTYNATDSKLGNGPSLVPAVGGVQKASFTLAQAFTIYVAGWSAAANSDIFGSNSGRTSLGALSNWYIDAGSVVNGGTFDTNAHAFCGVFNGASSALYVDSSSSAIASGSVGANGISAPAMGGPFNAAGGGIAEVVILAGSDSQTQRAQMFAYFTRRGIGITAS